MSPTFVLSTHPAQLLCHRLEIYFTYLTKGGKTATAANPKGTRAKDKDNVGMLASVGSPPPPGVPADRDPPGLTLSWKLKSGIIITMPIILAPKTAPTCVAS